MQTTLKTTNKLGLMVRRALFALIALFVLGLPLVATSLDYPHTDVNIISCPTCHAVHGTSPSLLSRWLDHEPQNIDDTGYNDFCWSCHNDVDAPFRRTHSSLTTSNSHGDWSVECRVCHDPHLQRQYRSWGSAAYLTSGASTALTTTTLQRTGAGWTVDQYKDHILIPNLAQPYNYQITGNTADTLTVKGLIDLTKAAVGNTYAIIYGKLVKSSINLSKINITPAKSGMKPIRFVNDTGARSFADGDVNYDGICEGCHTQTTHFRNDGTGSDQNHTGMGLGSPAGTQCTSCHPHDQGFKNICGTCHPATAASPPTDGNHPRHAGNGLWIGQEYFQANREFACSICHSGILGANQHINGVVNWEFDTSDSRLSASSAYSIPSGTEAPSDGITRPYGTCNNVYCHSIVQTNGGGPLTGLAGEYTTPSWGTETGCYGCHAGTDGDPTNYAAARTRHLSITTGSHVRHLPAGGSPMDCWNCHDWSRSNPGFQSGCRSTECHASTGEKTRHVNGSIDLFFATAMGPAAAYNGGSAPGDGYSTCSNNYCHSNGTSLRTGTIPANTSPVWGSGGPLACNACHGNNVYASPNDGMPNYPNGSPKENNHPKHVIDNGIACQNCHSSTTSNGTSVTAAHARKFYYYGASGSYAGKTIAFQYFQPSLTNAGYCNNISCHGYSATNLPALSMVYWGATIGCSNCHRNASDADNYVYGTSPHATINSSQWTSTGHGKASGTYTATGNPAANLPGAAGSGDPCSYCHDKGVNHNTAANPFRLVNTGGGDGQNGNCLVCHKAGSAGYDPDGAGAMQSKNGTVKVTTAHYGADHGAGNNGGKFCWDCHDPHGDANVAMIHAEVTKQSDGTYGVPVTRVATSFTTVGTWGSYVNNTTYNGICQVCHTSTARFTGNTNYDAAHNAGSSCVSCHSH